MKLFLQSRKLICAVLVLFIVIGQLSIVPSNNTALANSIPLSDGATYFTDDDNWGGGAADSEADGDFDVPLTNSRASTYNKYPVEFKIENVDLLPTKSAHLIVRAYDVDEYKPTIAASGEWDRVFFSSNPADIALGPNYTAFPTTTKWNSTISSGGPGVNGADYKKEMPEHAYLGTLSGANNVWNTTVIPFNYDELDRIALGDNYVGVTIHHYFNDTRTSNNSTPNTGWEMKIDWAQLIIDGGGREAAEITEAGLKVDNGKVTIDTSLLPKMDGNFAVEVNVIEKTTENGAVIERNLGIDKKLFADAKEGVEQSWSNIVISDPGITPNKEYVVNIILFEDRGDGPSSEKFTNPGLAQHLVSFSTHDPVVENISKSGYRSVPTSFSADDFKDSFYMISGHAPNGNNLSRIQVLSLPDASKGRLELNGMPVTIGQEIAANELSSLTFVPSSDGFDGTVEFEWNGFNGSRYAADSAIVTINSSPEVLDFTLYMKVGEASIGLAENGGILDHYIDPGDEELEKVMISSLPEATKGKLYLDNGSGNYTAISNNQEIVKQDLSKLIFSPEEQFAGEVTFTWNAYDGIQYAKADATATIVISYAPVVAGWTVIAELQQAVEFTGEQFSQSPNYADEDGDPFVHATITVPSNLASLGKLTYVLDGITHTMQVGQAYSLTKEELDTLTFKPLPDLTEGATVIIPWTAYDGRYDADIPAEIKIQYYNKPIAHNEVIVVDEGATSIEIVVSGSYNGSEEAIEFGEIVVDPTKGTITSTQENDGLTLTYTPNASFISGKDSFTYTVKNEYGFASDEATVTIFIQKQLNGWVGDKNQLDNTVIKVIPGEAVKLSAVSSILAERLVADVDGIEVSLTLANVDTWETDGYKQWIKTDYVLPVTTAKDVYTSEFTAYDENDDILQLESNLLDNKFEVAEPVLTLTATPSELVGDGLSTSKVEATLTLEDGTPLAGVEVTFEVPANEGSFINPSNEQKVSTITVVTNAEGKATLTYQAAELTGTQPSSVIVTASVYDVAKGLQAEDELTIQYYSKPIADDKVIIVDEGTATINILASGSYKGSSDSIAFGEIVADPANGTVTSQSGSLQLTYTPNAEFTTGKDSFTYTVKNEFGFSSDAATVTVYIQKKLNGWVGDKEPLDTTVVKIIPGELLKLSAISSTLAEQVVAEVNGVDVSLTLVNSNTWEADGYKQWEKENYELPEATAKGIYTPIFTAYDQQEDVLQQEEIVSDNKFEVLEPSLVLTAKPSQLVGDGRSTSQLDAQLMLEDGTPIAGVDVTFTAPLNGGAFIDPSTGLAVSTLTVTTNVLGKAIVTYQSSLITGVEPQDITVTASVFDLEKGLKAEDLISITFMPAEVKGIITEDATNKPVANAIVTVSLDLNGDGVIDPAVDFVETTTTDENGAYQIIVPKGNAVYTVEITKNVDLNGVEVPVTYTQKAVVGNISGNEGESFDSEKTVAGLILIKQLDGTISQLPSIITDHAVVYVKNADGQYIERSGEAITFTVNAQGVYAAEGLEVGEYEIEIRYEYEPGKFLVLTKADVQVKASGEMNITQGLVDPFGTITDGRTGLVIEGAKVELYYADTERNKGNNITPNTPVILPEITGFEPNNNASPVQLTDEHGFYAYMVYPETDYYLVISKAGYSKHKSPVIAVEWDIVQYNAQLFKQLVIDEGSNSYSPAINLEINKNIVREGNQTEIVITYKNGSNYVIPDGVVNLAIPEGVKVIDASGGVLTDGVLTWKIKDLYAGQSSKYTVVIEWPLIDQSEKIYTLTGEFITGIDDAEASIKVNVFSDRFEQLQHQRYILGYPDDLFKPNRNMTRAELAAIVARLTINEQIEYELPYTDIREGHWATNYIKIATKYGYFVGNPDGKFRPDEAVTRAELVAVMARFLDIKASTAANNHFTDTKTHWAGNVIEALYAGKYLSGYPDGSFKPNNDIIRVEAVTMINNILYRGPLLGHAPLFPDMPETHWGFGEVQEATISHEATRNEDGSETFVKKIEDNMQ